MENMAPPTKILGVTIIHKCNFHCAHCGYLYVGNTDDHDIKPGYRLTWEQIQRLIADCNSIRDERFAFVINGGEPTLWEEGALKFIDLLFAVAEGGISPSFNTNGSYFVDYDQCYDFFHQYAEKGKMPLMTAISMDKFHDNYDREKGRADSLDNIVKVFDEMPVEQRAMHRVHVITIVSKDPNSFLPKEMKEYYGAKGITFGDFPLQPIGRAKELMDEMPDSTDFFDKGPPPMKKGEKVGAGMPVGTLIGEYYVRGEKRVAKLGHLKDLLFEAKRKSRLRG